MADPNAGKPLQKKQSTTTAFGYNGLGDQTSILRKEELKEFSQTFEYVMVFPMEGDTKDTQSVTAKYAIHEMLGAGFELYPYLSVQKDELIVLIRCPVFIRNYPIHPLSLLMLIFAGFFLASFCRSH